MNKNLRVAVDSSIRVQFYHMDGGVYRKTWIQHVSKEEYARIYHNERGGKAIRIKEDDWYGKKLPDILR